MTLTVDVEEDEALLFPDSYLGEQVRIVREGSELSEAPAGVVRAVRTEGEDGVVTTTEGPA